MRTDLNAMRADAAYIRGRIESLPTTWQMIGTDLRGEHRSCGRAVHSDASFRRSMIVAA
jgi:hypothetical protein